ncbi:MAG: methylenetetrahydrofolate--tRNA-(uracil(54)-C(5))-methyltransferase (FADH(2)-oxidizing) TrmFO [Ruminococcaceae bacterium]|nr:methylenetetrahydrofolate--tRNA-(uracil(54)-C(5))-methyltransferase (FADH(2)-oxidizing) TrmFO [Oscillospiraceae bacterium]
MDTKQVTVIGAGLAGCEAAWALANRGFKVRLCEMKPQKYSPAHKYSGFAELVCSNSLKSADTASACGMLKEEMRYMGSVTMQAAEKTKVSAGGALAVNRELFSDAVTEAIKNHPNIEIVSEEITEFPKSNTIIATGPLTSDAFAEKIRERCGEQLSFYDAAAPIVTAESIDMSLAFFATRYDKGEADYINCPMTRGEYEAFYNELVNAESVPLKTFENLKVYEGCMPVEVLAKRGIESVRYGCMKPVGLTDPRTGRRPYAVVQLRKENNEGTLYNLVGFQTNLKFGEQKRVFSMITGLQNAEFVRYGVMHRNTFLNGPQLLDKNFMLKDSDNIYFAGQITGVEGYVESAASGIVAGINLAHRLMGKEPLNLPDTCMTAALSKHISTENKDFQPMGANMGILPALEERIKDKKLRYRTIADRGLSELKAALDAQL